MTKLLLEREIRGCTDSTIVNLERTLVTEWNLYPSDRNKTEQELKVVRDVMKDRGISLT